MHVCVSTNTYIERYKTQPTGFSVHVMPNSLKDDWTIGQASLNAMAAQLKRNKLFDFLKEQSIKEERERRHLGVDGRPYRKRELQVGSTKGKG